MPAVEGTGRNPFVRFLVHFKRNNKEKLCNMRPTQVLRFASKKWKQMSCEEKSPYVQAAHKSKYKFWSRNKEANRIMGKFRQTVGCANPQTQDLFKMMGDLDSWRQSVLDDLLGDDE